MINHIQINSIDDIKELIFEQNFDNSSKRFRNSFLYRGVSSSKYQLITSLERNCKEKKDVLESCILRNFEKYAILENANISSSVWHQLFLGQHHGLPTRILDWTYSPLVALHFACSSTDYQNFENQDFALWKISVEEINKLLPQKYQDQLEREASYLFTVKTLSKIAPSLNEYDYDMGTTSMAIIEPPSIDPRIINQYSIFTIVPRGISNVETFLNDYTFESYKYTISKELRWQLRDLLDSFNINERIIYPGLNGIAQWLARHYYVK